MDRLAGLQLFVRVVEKCKAVLRQFEEAEAFKGAQQTEVQGSCT